MNIKALAEKILARYERTRRMCLRYGNRHPDSDAVCHQAITGTHNVDGFAKFLALELDDMKLDTEQLASALLRVMEDAERLTEALVKADHHVRINAEAEHMLDGLRGRIPRSIDGLVKEISDSLESHNKLMEELGGD